MKFKVGDKVTPIKKSVGCNLSDSSVYENYKKQGYLVVTAINFIGYENKVDYVCNGVMSEEDGDFFMESDLVLYEDPKTPYQLDRSKCVKVRVRDQRDHPWFERYLIDIRDRIEAICVSHSTEDAFLHNNSFETDIWKFWELIPQPKYRPFTRDDEELQEIIWRTFRGKEDLKEFTLYGFIFNPEEDYPFQITSYESTTYEGMFEQYEIKVDNKWVTVGKLIEDV